MSRNEQGDTDNVNGMEACVFWFCVF